MNLRWPRVAVLLVVGVYVTATAWFLYRHVLGDSASHPLGYFFTWDMFPNYPSWSARRIALAQTRSGKYLQIFPSDRQQFRKGRDRSYSRFDLPRSDAAFREAVEVILAERWPIAVNDPVTYVFLLEQYWPVKFNLPENLYESVYGEPNPHRKYWRVVDESTVTAGGRTRWLQTSARDVRPAPSRLDISRH